MDRATLVRIVRLTFNEETISEFEDLYAEHSPAIALRKGENLSCSVLYGRQQRTCLLLDRRFGHIYYPKDEGTDIKGNTRFFQFADRICRGTGIPVDGGAFSVGVPRPVECYVCGNSQYGSVFHSRALGNDLPGSSYYNEDVCRGKTEWNIGAFVNPPTFRVADSISEIHRGPCINSYVTAAHFCIRVGYR
jgi:hypothetical protein